MAFFVTNTTPHRVNLVHFLKSNFKKVLRVEKIKTIFSVTGSQHLLE